ncbi:MAG: sugar ABC transporter substrate-binding protein [Parvibaculaceae bacterium]
MKSAAVLLTWSAAAFLATGAILAGGASRAEDGPPGITKPTVLPPFDPAAASCTRPPDRVRELVFSQDNEREFMQGVSRGLALAAKDRGLGYDVLVAQNDPGKQIAQVQSVIDRKSGALVAAPVDAMSLHRSLQHVIWQGSYVGTVVPPPATSLLNAPQYLTGKVLGDAAAAYVRAKLDGKANVVLLTHDSLQFLAPRFAAMRDALKNMPGVTIVADISPNTVDRKGGYETMKTILLVNPDVDVVLGADTVVLGAMDALREAGKLRADQFLGGIDGEPDAVAELKKAGAYKTSVSLASPVFGYAMGQHAADWLDGKSIPQAMDILPIALNAETIAGYEADTARPDLVYADPARRAHYLRMFGNICYDNREDYVNFPWSSESPPQ